MDLGLKGKRALVCGASKGLGFACADALAAEGVDVVIVARGAEALSAAAERIRTAHGVRVEAVATDITTPEGRAEALLACERLGGSPDILINNAGINKDQLLIRMKPEDFDSVINVNLRGAFLCTRYAMTHLIRQRSGRIINMSYVVGLSGNPGQANYAAAKAGLIGLTKAVAREVASRNVTVNALAPGYITTSMVEEIPEDKQAAILAKIPMGRFGTPSDVAEAVIFLCSDGASYITGQVLTIDGGMIA